MSQTFPFTNPDPGWADGQKLYAAQISIVAANAAQAADGLLWSDAAIFKNFSKLTTTSGSGTTQCIFWDSYLRRWINGYSPSGNPGALWSHDGKEEWTALTVTAGTNWNFTASGASNSGGTILLGGGGVYVTASKIRQSVDGGGTWTARSTTASSTEQVIRLHWFAAASLFIAALNTASSINIETSPDGASWTQRSLPNSGYRGAIASNGTCVIILDPSGASNKALRSTNGTTYAEVTMPATAVWSAVTWSAQLGKFFAIGGAVIASSADGITWSSAGGLAAPFASNVGGIVSYGRMLVAAGQSGSVQQIHISADGGVSWEPVKTLATTCAGLAYGDCQVLAIATNLAYSSLRGGL